MFSQGRKKTFILGTVSHYGTTMVSIVVGLISVPIGLHYFGPVRYGIWAVISSLIAYLNFSNLGITAAVQTLIAKASEPFEQRTVLQQSLFLLLISSFITLSVVLGIAHFYPSWNAILGKIPANLQGEAAEAVKASAIFFLLNLPLTIFSAGFTGLQKVYLERFYFSLTIIANLLALILVVFLLKGNLITLALSIGMARLFVSIICALHFLFSNTKLHQKFNDPISKEFSTKLIFTSGIRFFVIGISGMVVWNTDNLVISHFMGAEMVTPYAVTFKLFALGFSIFMGINGALWPMYGQSAGRNNWAWVQQTYNHVVHLLPILGGLLWIGGIAFAKEIINLWAGSEAYGGLLLVIALGGYSYTLSLVNSHATILSALNRTKNLVVFGWAEAIANLGISIALVKPLGIGGVALGTFLSSLLTVSWMLPMDIYKQTEGKVKFHFHSIFSHGLFILFPCLIASLFVYNYCQSEIYKVFINIGIVCTYLVLSWRVIPPELHNLINDVSVKIYTRIKNLRVLNV